MMKYIFWILIFLGGSFSAQAQETILISKAEVIAKANESNNTLKMAEQDVWQLWVTINKPMLRCCPILEFHIRE
ncbi:hypothetical protein ACU8V7_20610 [Zobellia nedashkovskayae]